VKSLGLQQDYKSFYKDGIALALFHNYNTGKNQFVAEMWWHQADRPYYCIWPAVIPMFLKLKLDIDSGLILPPKQPLALRMPTVNNPLKFEYEGKTYEARAMLLNEAEIQNVPGVTVWIDFGETDENGAPIYSFQNFQIKSGSTIEQIIEELPIHKSAKIGVIVPKEFVLDCIRLVCAVCLLGDDPTLITPDILNADLAKWEKNHDEKYVEKAHRRHKIGWHIGKQIEVIPHFRRPHFAWYHTGPGGKIPQLILRTGEGIGGTIEIHKRMIEKIPTGYMDK
jgi:hypothetical protein